MVVVRAHFDGRVIVPDEPLQLEPSAKVVVLVDADRPASDSDLEKRTREYYQSQSAEERAEDEDWGNVSAQDVGDAWEE